MKCFHIATLSTLIPLLTLSTAAEDTAQAKQAAPETIEETITQAREEALEEAGDAVGQAVEEVFVLAQPWEREKQDPEHQKKLDAIVLPKNPSREQCQAYLKELEKAVENKNRRSSDDPEVDMLKAIPAEHSDLVFALIDSDSGLDFYASRAVRDIDPKTIRKSMVKHLEDNPTNIGIIVMYGWANDAKPVIMKKLKTADRDISAAWYQAFVEVASPKQYPRLHEIAVGSPNAAQYIDLLKTLPDYDLSSTIDACWEKKSNRRNRHHFHPFYQQDPETQLAVHAASIGKVDALALLIDRLQDVAPDRHGFGDSNDGINTTRLNVTRFIPIRGSNEEILAWFKKNKDQLVFDHFKQRFAIEEDF